MDRRSFLKRSGMLIGISYVAPFTLIKSSMPPMPITKIPSINTWVQPSEIAREALSELEWALFVKPAGHELAEKVDK